MNIDLNLICEIAGGAGLATIVAFFLIDRQRRPKSRKTRLNRKSGPRQVPQLVDANHLAYVPTSPTALKANELSDPYVRLKMLKELRDSDAITDAEFQAQKRKILGS